MTRKNILMILPIMFSLLLIPNLGTVFAEHGHEESSSGGGCGGDCTPPTLGMDNAGVVHVEGGFAINGQIFDVEHFKQDIPTQTAYANEPLEITVKVFENSGPANLKHVGVMLGLEEKFSGYSWIQTHLVEIFWEQDFEGNELVETNNPYDFVKDVDVKVDQEDTITILRFSFTPTETFDTSTIIVQMWDQNRNLWTNHFYDSLEIETNSINLETEEITLTSTESETQKEESEPLQEEHEVPEESSLEEIQCGPSYELVYRASNMTPLCVSPYSASVLIEYGWAVPAQ